MDANEVLGIVEWALGGVMVVGLAVASWLHRQHRDLERRVGLLEAKSEDLEPVRKILEDGAFNSARRIAKGVKR